MSLLSAIFGKVESLKQAEQQRLETNYASLVRFIIDETLQPTREPKTKDDRADVESAIEVHADYLKACIEAGVATEQQVKDIAQAAANLKQYLEDGESKEVDTVALEESFQALIEKTRKELADAQRAVHDGRDANIARMTARQNAQRLILERPELAPMAQTMGVSWSPRTSTERRDETPTDDVADVGLRTVG